LSLSDLRCLCFIIFPPSPFVLPEQVWSIFPKHWRVTRIVCMTFCSITRAQLAEILDHQAGSLDVQALLQVEPPPDAAASCYVHCAFISQILLNFKFIFCRDG
jgi:hypothetical protein